MRVRPSVSGTVLGRPIPMSTPKPPQACPVAVECDSFQLIQALRPAPGTGGPLIRARDGRNQPRQRKNAMASRYDRPLVASSQSYGCPFWPRAIATSQATIKVTSTTSPAAAVARWSIWAKRSSRATVRPRTVSLRPVSSKMSTPKAARIASEPRPAPNCPPSQLTTNTTRPSPRLNSGSSHREQVIARLALLIIEHLLHRDAEVASQRHRQRQRGGVAPGLDRVDRLPGHPHRLGELALGQVALGPQSAHEVLHRLGSPCQANLS